VQQLRPLIDASLVAFAAAADLETSHAFYCGVLGLERVEASAFANAYSVHGTQLRVTLVERPARASYTVLGWRVADVAAAVAALRAAGVEVLRYDGMDQDADGVWTSPSGARVAWFCDPDANVLSVTQAA
jgi:catechol 2,3-dioxygenase-like lactoylglutathione lyase family enzyme